VFVEVCPIAVLALLFTPTYLPVGFSGTLRPPPTIEIKEVEFLILGVRWEEKARVLASNSR
jgi:hypothetical protein